MLKIVEQIVLDLKISWAALIELISLKFYHQLSCGNTTLNTKTDKYWFNKKKMLIETIK